MAGGKAFELAIKIGGEMLPSLRRSVENAQKQISTLSQTVSRDLDGAFRKAEKSMGRVTDNRLWRASAAGAMAFVGATGLAVNEAIKWDTAMANVRKGLGDAGQDAMDKFSAAALKLSTEMPVAGDELLNIGSQFAMAGEDIEDLIPLMRTAARMSVAFDMSGAAAADSMLALRASTGKSNEELVKLADAINHVSDNIKGKVLGGDLLQLTSDLAGIATATSLTSEEFAGLGAAVLATGTPVERARTGLKNLLNAMQAGTTATTERLRGISMIFGDGALADPRASKAQKAAAKKSSMQLADDLAQRMVDDPKAAIADLIERMSKLGKKEMPQALKLLVGEEGKAAIAPLLTNPELVREAMGLVANPMDYDGSMLREFENQAQSTSAQMQIFRNSLAAIGISIGSALLPAINELMQAVHPYLQTFSQWALENKALVGTITVLGLALSGLILLAPGIAALGSLIGSLGAWVGGLNIGGAIAGNVGGILGALKAGGAIAGVKALGAAFAAILGPVGLAIAAIVGAGLALKALYDKVPAFRNAVDDTFQFLGVAINGAWKNFKKSISALWVVVKATLGFVWDIAKGTWDMIVGLFTGNGWQLRQGWSRITGAMGKAWQALTEGLDQVLPGLGSMLEGYGGILVGLWKLDLDKMAEGWNKLKEGWEKIRPELTDAIEEWWGMLSSRMIERMREDGEKAGKGWLHGLKTGLLDVENFPFRRIAENMADAITGTRRGYGALPPSAAELPDGSWPTGVPRVGTPPAGMQEYKLGGAVQAMKPIIVGDRGVPEVFVPPVSGRIVPHRDLLTVTQKLAFESPMAWMQQPAPAQPISQMAAAVAAPRTVEPISQMATAVAAPRTAQPISQMAAAVATMPQRAFGGPVWRDRPVIAGEHRPEVFIPSGYDDPFAASRQDVMDTSSSSMVVNIGGIKIEGADTSNPAAIESAVTNALRQAERRWSNRAGQRVRLLLND